MARAVIYTVPFRSFQGGDTLWELDIIFDADVNNTGVLDFPIPGYTIGGTPVRLQCEGSPISIQHTIDDNIYKPITGSSADIRLLVTDGFQPIDFNTLPEASVEVRLRYEEQRSVTTVPNTGINGPARREFEGTVYQAYGFDGLGAAETFNLIAVSVPDGVTYTIGDTYSLRIAGVDLPGLLVDNIINVNNNLPGGQTVFFSGVTEAQIDELTPLGTDIGNDVDNLADFSYFTASQVQVFSGNEIPTTVEMTSMEPYWCGIMNPIGSSEQITTAPFGISFTATDGLGLLTNRRVPVPSSLTDVSLFRFITRALRQTTLELPIYVDSGISNANGDALTDSMISEYIFYDRENGDRATLRESVEQILASFNCKVFQAEGAWWIVNCSTHGTTTSEIVPAMVPDPSFAFALNGPAQRDIGGVTHRAYLLNGLGAAGAFHFLSVSQNDPILFTETDQIVSLVVEGVQLPGLVVQAGGTGPRLPGGNTANFTITAEQADILMPLGVDGGDDDATFDYTYFSDVQVYLSPTIPMIEAAGDPDVTQDIIPPALIRMTANNGAFTFTDDIFFADVSQTPDATITINNITSTFTGTILADDIQRLEIGPFDPFQESNPNHPISVTFTTTEIILNYVDSGSTFLSRVGLNIALLFYYAPITFDPVLFNTPNVVRTTSDMTLLRRYVAPTALDNTEEYIFVDNITRNLGRTVNGTDTTDLSPLSQDFYLSPRRPYGSVQANIATLQTTGYVTNGGFEQGTSGWTSEPTSATTALTLSDTTFLSGTSSITTNRNAEFPISDEFRWFRNSEGIEVLRGAPIEVSFNALYQSLRARTVAATLHFQVYIEFDNPTGIRFLSASGANGNIGGALIRENVARMAYNFERGKFEYFFPLSNQFSTSGDYIRTVDYDTAECWSSHSEELNGLQDIFSQYGENALLPDSDGRLFISFFYPEAIRENGDNVDGSTTEMNFFIDDIIVKNLLDNSVASPIFERVQEDFTDTLEYDQVIVSDQFIPNIFDQKLAIEFYNRNGHTERQSIEELVTQQKLNDYRQQLQYFEATFINRNDVPLGLQHKIKIDYNTYGIPSSAIINGMDFDVKSNTYNVAFYIPNQATDIAPTRRGTTLTAPNLPGFYLRDVDLISAPFTGRGQASYTVRFDGLGLDDDGNPLNIVDANGVMPGDTGYIVTNVLQPTEPFVTFTGTPGEIFTHKLILRAAPGFEASASNMSVVATDDEPLPTFTTVRGGIQDIGETIELSLEIRMPRNPEFEVLTITGEVDPFIGDNRAYDITFALTDTDNATITATMLGLRSSVGSVVFADAIISPSVGRQLTASTFAVSGTLPEGVMLLGFTQLGTSVVAQFAVTIQATNQMATITLDGDGAVPITGGVETSTVTLTISESITNVSINRTSLVVSGFVGQRSPFSVAAYAADGFELSSNNFSAVESSPVLTMFDAVGEGESVEIPFDITFPATDTAATVTINGSAQEVGADTVDVTVTFVNSDPNAMLTETSETFRMNPAQTMSYTNTLTPVTGFEITDAITSILSDPALLAVANFTTNSVSKYQANIGGLITAPSASTTVNFDVASTTAAEPYVATLRLTENLPQGRLITSTLTTRFGPTDIAAGFVPFNGVTIAPNEGSMAYPTTARVTASGATVNNFTNANGNIIFDLAAILPTFNDTNLMGDVSLDVTISTAAAPIAQFTRIFIDNSGLRNCTTTLNGGAEDFIDVPFSTSNTTISYVAARIGEAAFRIVGMNQPVVVAILGLSASSGGTQSEDSFSGSFTLPPQTAHSTIVVRFTGGADVDAVTVNGFNFTVSPTAPTGPANNMITLVPRTP